MTKAMKDWLDQQIRQAGADAQRSTDPLFHVSAAARMVALAQVRAEVWKMERPPVPENGGQQPPHHTASLAKRPTEG